MRVLGIDPGLGITGYGVIDTDVTAPRLVEAGVIRTNAQWQLEQRLVHLFDHLTQLLEELQPDSMAVEALFQHYARPRTAIIMGHARGVLFLAAARQNIDVAGYPPARVKKYLTGFGAATKTQMQHSIMHRLGLPEPPQPADVADALAVALCHAQILERRFRRGDLQNIRNS